MTSFHPFYRQHTNHYTSQSRIYLLLCYWSHGFPYQAPKTFWLYFYFFHIRISSTVTVLLTFYRSTRYVPFRFYILLCGLSLGAQVILSDQLWHLTRFAAIVLPALTDIRSRPYVYA